MADLSIKWEVKEYSVKIADRSVKDSVFLIRNSGPSDVVVKTWSGLHSHLTSDDLVLEAHHERFIWVDHGLTIAPTEDGGEASGTALFCR